MQCITVILKWGQNLPVSFVRGLMFGVDYINTRWIYWNLEMLVFEKGEKFGSVWLKTDLVMSFQKVHGLEEQAILYSVILFYFQQLVMRIGRTNQYSVQPCLNPWNRC
jgi:hypothetical protein